MKLSSAIMQTALFLMNAEIVIVDRRIVIDVVGTRIKNEEECSKWIVLG